MDTRTAPSEATEEPPAPVATRTVVGWVVVALVVAVAAGRMADVVLSGSSLQHSDYWLMLGRFANPDGSLDLAGVVAFQNHPVVVAQLVYWLNMQLFAGSNISLGVLDIVLCLATVGLIALIAVRSSMRRVEQMVTVATSGLLLFTLNGTWNFAKAMSGTAWFSANLLVILAVVLRARDRAVLAFAAGVVASVSYGTGIVVWPALVAVGLVRRPPREWWRELPYAAAFAVTFVWYRSVGEGAATSPGVLSTIDLTATLLAQPLGLDGRAAQVAGYLALLGIAGLGARCARAVRTEAAAAWLGVATFGTLATALVAHGRYEYLAFFGEQSRYTSLAALAWVGLIGLAFTVVGQLRDARAARNAAAIGDGVEPVGARSAAGVGPRVLSAAPLALCLVLAVTATTSGADTADELLATVPDQQLREIALHLGLTDGTVYLLGGLTDETTQVEGLLRTTSQYPFVDGWDLDCGLIGQPLPGAERAADPTADATGRLVFLLRGAVEISGSVPSDQVADCIVVTGPDGVVVGAGVEIPAEGRDAGEARPYRAIARPGIAEYRVFATASDGSSPVLLAVVEKPTA